MRLSARRVKLSKTIPRHGKRVETGGMYSQSPSQGDSDFLRDRTTFNQLFWLVMMCDTLSAAINNRLTIVSDEDSVILSKIKAKSSTASDILEKGGRLGWEEGAPSISSAVTSSDIDETPWGTYFLGMNQATHSAGLVQWPFTKEYATTLLSEAAPVKALLYRKVKQIQNLQFRRARSDKLEQAILGALKVYEHWNKKYGNFITTCIQHHDELPLQVQSWYLVLTGHWNLATFLLSDLIEELDQAGETDEHYCSIRRSCGLLFHIRRQSAFEMADIGKVGRGREDCGFSQANDFHPAVNNGVILTEPWTEIMIRSFARCSEQYLTWLAGIDHLPENGATEMWASRDFGQLYLNLGYCIEALLNLGRKSDMAFLLTISLKRRMARFDRA